MDLTLKDHLHGEITVPGDKSISHRGIMLGAISEGDTYLNGFLNGADCISTISCFRGLGIDIDMSEDGHQVTVHGKGLDGLSAPAKILDVGNSGTTMRLISGILSAQNFDTVLTGDPSIRKRPMGRIITPLSLMGADISSAEGGRAPLSIHGRRLSGTDYVSPVASAQVKSCVLLAGLYAEGSTTVTEPYKSRDHTELMLRGFGADVKCEGSSVTVSPRPALTARSIDIPGDISSAAYWIAAALITPGSELLIRNTGINPTRAGIIEAARRMNADITLLNERTVSGEPVADILVRSSALKGTVIEGDIIPRLIDELPLVALMGAFAEGETVIRDAEELRVKESDRIALITENLSAMNADITASDDGMTIRGGRALKGSRIKTAHDHRIAMTFAIASMAADGVTVLDDEDCVRISYPDFFKTMKRVSS